MAKEYIEERDGNYYVAGTRVSLDSIVHAFRRRESPETISQDFEQLRLEEVYGAIANSLANQANIDAYLVRQNEMRAEGRRDAEPLPASLRERLMRARDELHHTAYREGSVSGRRRSQQGHCERNSAPGAIPGFPDRSGVRITTHGLSRRS